MTPFAFSDLVTKRALHEAGYAVSHLSRDSHGFSQTRFGRRWLNPIKTGIERRYVAERLVMTEENPLAPLRALALRLRQNRLVSITVASTGQVTRLLDLLDGRIRIATGALALAWQTGAPLLPVFTLREPDGALVTRIEPALPPDRRLDRAAAVADMLAAYGRLLEAYVLRSPDQFPLAYLATGPDADGPARAPVVSVGELAEHRVDRAAPGARGSARASPPPGVRPVGGDLLERGRGNWRSSWPSQSIRARALEAGLGDRHHPRARRRCTVPPRNGVFSAVLRHLGAQLRVLLERPVLAPAPRPRRAPRRS